MKSMLLQDVDEFIIAHEAIWDVAKKSGLEDEKHKLLDLTL